MVREINDLSEAFAKAKKMLWAYVATDSSLTLGFVPGQINWDQVQEARFFSYFAEVRIFRQGDTLTALWVDDTPCPGQLETVVDTRIELYRRFGQELTLRRHIVFDEDGQACVYTTRFVHWKGVSQVG